MEEEKNQITERLKMLSKKVRAFEPLDNTPAELYDIVPLRRVFNTSFDFSMSPKDQEKIIRRFYNQIDTAIYYTIAWLFGGKIIFEGKREEPERFKKGNYQGVFDKEVLVCAVSCLPYLMADFFPECNTPSTAKIREHNNKLTTHINAIKYLEKFKSDFEELNIINWSQLPLSKEFLESKKIKGVRNKKYEIKGSQQIKWWSHHQCFRYLARILELSDHKYLGKEQRIHKKKDDLFVHFTKFFHNEIEIRGARTIRSQAQKHLPNSPSDKQIEQNELIFKDRKPIPYPEYIEYFFKFHLHHLGFYNEQLTMSFYEEVYNDVYNVED